MSLGTGIFQFDKKAVGSYSLKNVKICFSEKSNFFLNSAVTPSPEKDYNFEQI